MSEGLRARGEAASRAHKLTFVPFAEQDNDGGSLDAVASQAGLRAGDVDDRGIVEVASRGLDVLLRMPFVDFIAVVIFDQDLRVFLDTYLETRRRPWDEAWREPLESEVELENLVMACLHRSVMDEDGRQELRTVDTLTADTFGMELKARGVITATRILDICVLFGQRYPRETSQLVQAMLELNDSLFSDLVKALSKVKDSVLPPLVDKICDKDASADREDSIAYLTDVMSTLAALASALGIKLGGDCIGKCWNSRGDLLGLFRSYGRVVAALTGPTQDVVLNSRLTDIRRGWLGLVHMVCWQRFWGPLNIVIPADQFDNANPELPTRTDVRIEELLDIFLAVVNGDDEDDGNKYSYDDDEDGEFSPRTVCLADYDRTYELQRRLEYLADEVYAMEFKERIEYTAAILIDLEPSTQSHSAQAGLGELRLSNASAITAKDIERAKKEQARKDAEVLQAKIKQLKDVMPELGSFFIEQLLQAKGGNVEASIQAVLEGNLPPQVASLETHLERAPLRAVDRGPQTSQELFAQFEGKGRNGKSGTSKKSGPASKSNADDEDEDDEEMRIIKQRIRAAAAAYDEYDDEYDDAYDDAGFQVGDDGNIDDKPFDASTWKPGMKDIDGVRRDAHGKIVEEPDENEINLLKPNLNHLVEPPSNTRSKNRRGGGRGPSSNANSNSNNTSGGNSGAKASNNNAGGNSGAKGGSGSNNDNKKKNNNNTKPGNNNASGDKKKGGASGAKGGAPKKDQDNASQASGSSSGAKNTQRDRRHKDQQKARVANHSRKRGAAKKMQRTMFGGPTD